MNLRSIGLIAGLSLASIATDVSAMTFVYTGNPSNNNNTGNYVSATVELNCSGPCADGTYNYNTGIASFILTDYSSSNAPLFTLSSLTTPPPAGSYIVLNSGQVTDWSLYNVNSAYQIYTRGLSPVDLAYNLTEDHYMNYTGNDPGTWSVASAVPGPVVGAGLPGLMMALGGLLVWRRRSAAA